MPMLRKYRMFAAVCLLALTAPLALAATPATLAAHRVFRVTLDVPSDQPVSGRLLLFAIPADKAKEQAHGGKVEKVDTSAFFPTRTAVAAMDVESLASGKSVLIDADALAFPKPFSRLAPGTYDMQAVLDVNRDYNFSGRGPGDLVSPVVEVTFGTQSKIPTLDLKNTVPAARQPWTLPTHVPPKYRKMVEQMAPVLKAAHAHSRKIDFVSPALSKFWGRPMHIQGWVLLPPGYDRNTSAHYPTVYLTPGYGARLNALASKAVMVWEQMSKGGIPPMIWVFLNESSPRGTHEFADSANNGPWGTALTTELIPYLETQYRMDGKPSGRFLTGHSSGGWATLWLQVRYPKVFGGTWSTSPDPSDFHDFTGPDLYAPNANVYYKPDGKPYPLVRANGKVIATFKQFAQLERVLGPYGGQMASFEWVFSPRGADGRPEPMFDRDTGKVNTEVVKYWRDHYDIAHRIKTKWPELKPDLDGKIHLIVGTADTFYLNQSAQLLKKTLDSVGAKAEVEFLPGKTHFDLLAKGKNRHWLLQQITWAMYHHARPEAKIPADYSHEIHH
ncbi:MAG TPA: alpha/beta hydrolase-fold protein [Rhodanobacteraceae bacterium]|nr:alpha/beta hydrolase-fold protein [Rhodanobacteraceae bacterium]